VGLLAQAASDRSAAPAGGGGGGGLGGGGDAPDDAASYRACRCDQRLKQNGGTGLVATLERLQYISTVLLAAIVWRMDCFLKSFCSIGIIITVYTRLPSSAKHRPYVVHMHRCIAQRVLLSSVADFAEVSR